MITKILVPTDGSKTARKAARYAVDLAKQVRATVIALSVVDQRAYMLQSIPDAGAMWHVAEPVEIYLREAAERFVEDIKQYGDRVHVRTKTVVAVGHPSEEIMKEAQRSKASLIVMGTHGRSALGAAVLGSVTYRVIHKDAKIPVLVVKG
jgi:nucleotide-binding universal stress UspA family protein